MTPQEWRSQDMSNRVSLRIATTSNFKLLRDNLHARKNNEINIRISPDIAQREDKIAGANV